MGSTWLVASTALGRPVSTDEPYPHICSRLIPRAETTSQVRDVRLNHRQCATCAEERFRRWGSYLSRIASELCVLADLVIDLHRELCRIDGPAASQTADVVQATANAVGAAADDLDRIARIARVINLDRRRTADTDTKAA